MANKAPATTSWRWRLLLLLLLAVAALCWIPPAIAMAAAAAAATTSSGGRRSLLGFVEAQGNSSYRCSPSGPCVPCQYSEKLMNNPCSWIATTEEVCTLRNDRILIKSDEKYCCSETGYRLPLKCVEVQNVTKEGNNTKQRKVLDDASTSGGSKHYTTYRSCVPLEDEEKLSVLGFEVMMAGMLLISGPFVYYRKRRTAIMQGASRIPTSPPRF
ncbi:Os09g0560400 [Oryza sativa Japonica Group]|uniref:Os09g0560400 protein n=1 Tax=Oryza sativa subsp. japonica TaxID=39947 RepID=Q0IZM5_ORYSJ|nr:Os09g0560400 [Oryza sativa Japonica Group]|eukprot:NP_001063926.1 Os09g0560400 [Oryza sativa Japonica Group]